MTHLGPFSGPLIPPSTGPTIPVEPTPVPREVLVPELPEDHEAMEELVERVTREMEEERLRDHLASADAVIHGTVVEVRPAAELPQRFSEHDPEWCAEYE